MQTTNVPIAAVHGSFTFTSEVDGKAVFVRQWLPPVGIPSRAVVQITHGIAEHSGRYERFARFLSALGCVAYAIDLRGHGETAGPDQLGQAGLTAWADMSADIRQLSVIARAENPALPLIAFGHSMGSALTQSHMQHHGELLSGAILCGTLGALPGLDEAEYAQLIEQLRALGAGDSARVPSVFFGTLLTNLNAPFVDGVRNPSGSEWQTSDRDEVRAFQADPLCGKPFANAMTYSVLKGMHDLWLPEHESAIPLDLPILIVAGTDDPVGGRTKTIQALIGRLLDRGHLTLDVRFYAGGRHEILNDIVKDRVHRDVGHWLSHIVN